VRALVGHDVVHEAETGQRVVVVEQVADAVGELGVYEVGVAQGFGGEGTQVGARPGSVSHLPSLLLHHTVKVLQ